MFAFTSFSPTVSFHSLRHRNQLSSSDSSMEGNIRNLARLVDLDPKKGENNKWRHVQIKKSRDISTNFHLPILTHHFYRHLLQYTLKQPLNVIRLISPTYFHPHIFTHQFSPTNFHLRFFTHFFPPTQ